MQLKQWKECLPNLTVAMKRSCVTLILKVTSSQINVLWSKGWKPLEHIIALWWFPPVKLLGVFLSATVIDFGKFWDKLVSHNVGFFFFTCWYIHVESLMCSDCACSDKESSSCGEGGKQKGRQPLTRLGRDTLSTSTEAVWLWTGTTGQYSRKFKWKKF